MNVVPKLINIGGKMFSSTSIACTYLLTVACNAVFVFEDEPIDKSIRKGEDHLFTCSVSGMVNEELVWYKDGAMLLTDVTDNLRITIVKSELPRANLSTLGIQNVIRSDAGFYKCVVSHSILTSSSEAELTILSLPDSHYPICSEPESNILSGSLLTLTCVSEKVNPAVNLQFTRNSEPVNTGISFKETENLITLQLRITTAKDDNGDVYKCDQYSPLDSNYQKSCEMKSLNIQYKPKIKIQHTNPVLPGRETILFCQTIANPPVTRYQWKLMPQIREEDTIVDVTGQTLKLIRPLLQQSGTNITCIATNDIGQTSSSIKLKISNPRNSENGNKTYKSGDTISEHRNGLGLSLDVVIIIAAGVVVIIVLVVLVPVYHYCLCRNDNTMIINSSGKEVTQPEVYYETREGVILRHTIQDRSLPRVPTTEVYGHWRHSTASQVPNDLESHSYTYINTEND